MDTIHESKREGFDAHVQRNIEGQPTEFVFQKFTNKWFLLISQYAGATNFYNVTFDIKRENELPTLPALIENPDDHVSVPVTIICRFGVDKDEARSGILYLVNRSNLGKCGTEILMSLGLRVINGDVLKQVAAVVNEIIP